VDQVLDLNRALREPDEFFDDDDNIDAIQRALVSVVGINDPYETDVGRLRADEHLPQRVRN